MLLSKTVIMTWNSNNKKRYVDLGYEYTKMYDKFLVKVEDLPPSSKADVVVKCDYCGAIMVRRYPDYISGHSNDFGDTCIDCCQRKREQTNLEKYGNKCSAQNEDVREKYLNSIRSKYGVDYYFQTNEFKEKLKQTSLEKYGTEHPLQNKDIKQKVANTCIEKYGNKCFLHTEEGVKLTRETNINKYGYPNAMQSSQIREKAFNTLLQHGNVPTSKQQIAICNMFSNIYGDCKLNHPCKKYVLDCALNINDTWIDIEYDGMYWHKGKEDYDKQRDSFVMLQGYKVLRIKANKKDTLPTKEQLVNAIDYLVKDNHNYTEINMNI